jgi:hypothetical protein
METVKCPDCGRDIDITGMIDKALADYKFAIRSKGGRTTNAAKSEAQRANITQVNECYTTEKRKAAWAKRKANMVLAKKNKAEENTGGRTTGNTELTISMDRDTRNID